MRVMTGCRCTIALPVEESERPFAAGVQYHFRSLHLEQTLTSLSITPT